MLTHCRWPVVAATCAAGVCFGSVALAQAQTTPVPVCSGPASVVYAAELLPAYSIRQLAPDSVRLLRSYLERQCWALALQTYFSKYRPDLPDWVVYIDSFGQIRQALLSGRGDDSTSRVLVHQRYVWAVVFSDRPMQREDGRPTTSAEREDIGSRSPPACNPNVLSGNAAQPASGGGLGGANASRQLLLADTADLRLGRRVIAYPRDPMVTMLIKGLSKLVGVDPGPDPTLADSTRMIELQQVSADSMADSSRARMYAGVGRFGLVENTQVELSLMAVRCKEFPAPDMPPTRQASDVGRAGATSGAELQTVFADFVNARRHRFDLAILTGATWGSRIPTYNANLQLTNETARLAANAYLTAVWNVKFIGRLPSAELPWEDRPLGLFIGTNVARGNLGDELVAGGVLGSVFGNGGLAAGFSWVNVPSIVNGHSVSNLERRFLLGFDLRL